jgi:hypothetical protein
MYFFFVILRFFDRSSVPVALLFVFVVCGVMFVVVSFYIVCFVLPFVFFVVI